VRYIAGRSAPLGDISRRYSATGTTHLSRRVERLSLLTYLLTEIWETMKDKRRREKFTVRKLQVKTVIPVHFDYKSAAVRHTFIPPC